MAKRKPWYKTMFERDYYDYFYLSGPRTEEEEALWADDQVDFIVRRLDLPKGARLLDLCCGHGRHSVRLAQRGYSMTGLDLSAYHLRLAKAEARKAGVKIEWLHRDMRDIPKRRKFDGVLNVFTSFGYLENDGEDQKVLDGIARALKPGGRFFIDTINHDNLMARFTESDWFELPDGSLRLERRAYDIHTGRTNVDWILVDKDGERHEQSHSVRLYTYTELEAMLSKAGLTVRETWGAYDGREFSMESPRMVVLAEKG